VGWIRTSLTETCFGRVTAQRIESAMSSA